MGKRPAIFFILLVTFLFASACAYSLFDELREADLFSKKKYEEREAEDLYAGRGSNLDDVLVSATLFSPLPDIFFEFPPSFFSSNTLLVTPFSALRC